MAQCDQRRKHLRWSASAIPICCLAVVGALTLVTSRRAQNTSAPQAPAGHSAPVLNPDPRNTLGTPARELTEQERENMLTRKRQLEKKTSHP